MVEKPIWSNITMRETVELIILNPQMSDYMDPWYIQRALLAICKFLRVLFS